MGNYFLDGAQVICQAHGNFGRGNNDEIIVKLALARYDDWKDVVYLFACNAEDVVVGDLQYSSVDGAKRDALRFYDMDEILWRDV